MKAFLRQDDPDSRAPQAGLSRILIVTDAWAPQVNGVVRTLERLAENLPAQGAEPVFITPADSRTCPMPTYPDIRLALAWPGSISNRIGRLRPDHVHIATEGPLGIMARRACMSLGLAFTTSYHTRFPEYLSARLPVPEAWAYRWLRRFHNASSGTLVATPSLMSELSARGFDRLKLWSRGVDTVQFDSVHRRETGLPRPIMLSVGRVAVEKNLTAFLDLDMPGTKMVVGDGPERASLMARYPHVLFPGAKQGEELSRLFASADVFVFPSLTDTFGNVILEALASGVPVAAYPVTGPVDIFSDGRGGALSSDLGQAVRAALAISGREAREKALEYSWASCASIFMGHVRAARSHIHPIPATSQHAARTPAPSGRPTGQTRPAG